MIQNETTLFKNEKENIPKSLLSKVFDEQLNRIVFDERCNYYWAMTNMLKKQNEHLEKPTRQMCHKLQWNKTRV